MEATENMKAQIAQWNDDLKGKSAVGVIAYFLLHFGERIILSTSLGLEDQVLTEMVLHQKRDVDVFTLDTGRLFPETYDLIARTNKYFGIRMLTYFPEPMAVEKMVAENGINLFYDSVEKRKMCCGIRKVAQLPRAFAGMDAWICGLRKDQSVSRFFNKMVEWDANNGLVKINPLINWTEKEVWDYIKMHNIPYNLLHDSGFPSIGCEPCTRAIEPGEDIRAGRWWWENEVHKECGLHKR
ncbi:MAG: phosphoadenylyl-sulfate reductase [Bacteroidales bacterium]|nr:phosphoadenylyl-sulfate reductase [Bacteroidales bacterium]